MQRIEGLEALANLHELNLSGNQISALGHSLDSNAELETLYLSGNPLCSLPVPTRARASSSAVERLSRLLALECTYTSAWRAHSQELVHLTRLPKLQTLGLRDPQYASAPVTRLFNYLVFVLYHLPQLTRLDSYNVASKQLKDFAEALHYCSRTTARLRSHCRILDIVEAAARL